MDLSTGVSKRNSGAGKKPVRGGKKSRKTPTSRKSRKTPKRSVSRKSRKPSLPRTASVRSRKSVERIRASRANSSMSLTELQLMARSRGIPFGGLSRAKLVKKINNYMY